MSSVFKSSDTPRYGAWKFLHEISLQDMLTNPVWVWCIQVDDDGVPSDGDETSMRPFLDSNEVPLDHVAPPLILLHVKGTDYFGSALYNHSSKTIDSICLFLINGMTTSNEVSDLPDIVEYESVPLIGGLQNVKFVSLSKGSEVARMQTT